MYKFSLKVWIGSIFKIKSKIPSHKKFQFFKFFYLFKFWFILIFDFFYLYWFGWIYEHPYLLMACVDGQILCLPTYWRFRKTNEYNVLRSSRHSVICSHESETLQLLHTQPKVVSLLLKQTYTKVHIYAMSLNQNKTYVIKFSYKYYI